MKCVTIDEAREYADRRRFEELEKRQQEYEAVEAELIDERIDDMTPIELMEAIESVSWDALAQSAAQSNAKERDHAALGRVIADQVRDYAKRLMEREREQ